jgi:hypothetical protein
MDALGPKGSGIPDCLETPPATPQKSEVSGGRNRKDRPRYYLFEKLNEVTFKMTDGSPVNVDGAFGHAGYRVTRPLGYLMRVDGSQWVACVGKRRSGPLPLQRAKEAAKRMDREAEFDVAPPDPIRALHLAAIASEDVTDRKRWPIDIMGGQRRGDIDHDLRRCIVDTEMEIATPVAEASPPPGDDYQLDYYEDGYPVLPACLDRRR